MWPVANTLSNSLRSSSAGWRCKISKIVRPIASSRDTPCSAGFAFAIPRLNAIRAVDDVQADRQRVDDLLGEPALLVDLARSRRDFRLESMRVLGVAQRRREEVGDRREKEPVLGGQNAARPGGNGAEFLAPSEQRHGNHTISREPIVEAKQLFDGGRRRVVVRGSPGAPEAVEAPEPEARVSAIELAGNRRENPGHDRADRIAGRQRRSDLCDSGERAGNRPGGPMPLWGGKGYLGHDVWPAAGEGTR